MAGAIYPYRFTATTQPPPTAGQVRADAALGPTTTRVYLANVTDDGVDVHFVLMQLAAGAELGLQDDANHGNMYRFTATGAAIDAGTYVDVPVAFVESAGPAFANNAKIVALLYQAAPPDPDAPGAPIVPLDVAKEHLRVTGTAHDADIQRKLDAAIAAILDYLDDAADPDWTAATLPTIVETAMLMYLTHLYEHRGDDMSPSASGTTPDEDVWAAIRRLLARTRDQAIAVGQP